MSCVALIASNAIVNHQILFKIRIAWMFTLHLLQGSLDSGNLSLLFVVMIGTRLSALWLARIVHFLTHLPNEDLGVDFLISIMSIAMTKVGGGTMRLI